MSTNKKSKSKDKMVTRLIIILGTITLIVLYFVLTNREEEKVKNEHVNQYVNSIVSGDIELDYPATPREVVIFFNKLLLCYYENDLQDEAIKKVMTKERQLFDQELLDKNSFEEQFKDLKSEIKEYQKNNRTIISTQVEKSSEIEYWTQDGKEYSSVVASYTLKDKEVTKTFQRFVLRRDKEGKWRVLGWQLSSPKDL